MKLLLKIFLIFILIGAALFGIGLFLISSYGGNSPQWKAEVTKIIGSIIEQEVTIGTLHDARFYPAVSLSGEDIMIFPPEGMMQPGTVTIQSLDISVPFWGVFWGQPYFKTLQIEGLERAPAAGSEAIVLDFAGFTETGEDGGAELGFTGSYNSTPLAGGMEAYKTEKGFFFKYHPNIWLDLDGYPIRAKLAPQHGLFRLEEIQFGAAGDIKGTLYNGEDRRWYGGLTFNNVLFETDLYFEEDQGKPFISGNMSLMNWQTSKAGYDELTRLIEALEKYVGDNTEEGGGTLYANLNQANMDITFNMKGLKLEAQEQGELVIPLIIENGILSSPNMTGRLFGGQMTGKLTLDASQTENAVLALKAEIEGADPAALRAYLPSDVSVSGVPVNLALNLNGTAGETDNIFSVLQGTVTIQQENTQDPVILPWQDTSFPELLNAAAP